MAICPKCNEQVSEAAVICPHCGCNINEYKDNIKAEKEKKAREEAERKRQEANERKKQAELADRLICPDCGRKVTLEDKICPKCGFPLDDKGERERMKLWRKIQKNDGNKTFMDKWFATIIITIILACIIAYFCISLDGGEVSDLVLRCVFIIPPVLIGGVLIYIDLSSAYKEERNVKKKNFESYMIEDQNMGAEMFSDLVKHGMAHCPYCQRRLTENSLIYYNPNRKTDLKEIRCEHCGRIIDFPGDRLREDIKQSQIKKNFRRQRWGF